MIWSPQTVQKRQRKCFIYFPRFLPSDLHWGTQHQSLESLMGLSIFTVNDVVFTFTSGVATQTGSNDACSLRQITWSINEKTGVSAGMEMTRKYRISWILTRFAWSVRKCFRGGETQYNPRKTNYTFVFLNVINRKLLYIHNKLSIPCRNWTYIQRTGDGQVIGRSEWKKITSFLET